MNEIGDMSHIPGTPGYVEKQRKNVDQELKNRDEQIDANVTTAVLDEVNDATKEQMAASLRGNPDAIDIKMVEATNQALEKATLASFRTELQHRVANSLEGETGSEDARTQVQEQTQEQ